MPPNKINIEWTDEIKELLVNIAEEIDNEENLLKNRGDELLERFQNAIANSSASEVNKALIRDLDSFKTLTCNLSRFRKELRRQTHKKVFKWDEKSINTLISIYNDVIKIDQNCYRDQLLKCFREHYPLYRGTSDALRLKVNDEINKIANSPAKELEAEKEFDNSIKQIDWVNNKEYSNYLNECAADVRIEYSKYLRRKLTWSKERIYREISLLFWHKYPNLGSENALRFQIIRMNMIEQHNFGIETDHVPDKCGDTNMPDDYTNLERYWNYGQKFRQSPLFNSLCYRCGQLLHGKLCAGSKFIFPKQYFNSKVIPIETMYDNLPEHLPYKNSKTGNYYACRNCMNNQKFYLAAQYPLTNKAQRVRTGQDFPNIKVPEVIADLKTEYEINEVSLCGFFYNVLKPKQYFRNQYIKIYGEFKATHRQDKHYARLFSFMNSSIDYQSTRNDDSDYKIRKALIWFRDNNPQYEIFYSNFETLYHYFENSTNPIQIFGGIQFGESKMKVINRLKGEAEPSHLFIPADDFFADDEEMTADPETDILAIQHPINVIDAKKKIINQCWVKFCDYYLLPKTFPTLYPYGSGGYSKKNYLFFSFLDYCKMRLFNFDPRWRLSDNFKFYIADLILRQRIYYYNKNIVKTTNVHSAIDNTAGKIKDSKNLPYYQQLGHRLPEKLPGSRTFWHDKASNLLAMVAEEAPTFFVTLTQNDASAEIQSMFKEGDKIFVASQHGIFSQPITKKGRPVVNNPFESVLYMYKYLKDFIDKFIKDSNSPFGKNKKYFIRAEYQGRGAVHYHILLWSENETYDEITVVCAEMPRGEKFDDGKYDEYTELLRKMVRTFNTHKCSANCYKVVKGRAYRKKEENVCKYGFPFKKTSVEYLEQTGKRYHYVRRQNEDLNIVPYNRELMLHGYRHHNVQKVGPEFKLDYICKYVTKPEKSARIHVPAKANPVQRYIARRAVGICEISAFLAQIPQCMQSHQVIFLMTELEPKSRVIKRYEHLPKDRHSKDIYYQTKFEKYLTRPKEEPFASMEYPEFYARYRYVTDRSSRIEPRREDQNDSDDSDDYDEWADDENIDDKDLPVKKNKIQPNVENCFRDLRGRPFRKREHDALTRYKFYFKYGSAQKQWCLQQLMLFVAWDETTVDELKKIANSTEDLITMCIERNLINNTDLDDAKTLINAAKMRGLTRRAIECYAEILNEQGIFKENEYEEFKKDLEENDDWAVIDEEKEDGLAEYDESDDLDKRRVIQVNDLDQYVTNFSPTQRKAFDYIRENIENDNQLLLCVTGEAGTGKTFLIDSLTALFQQKMPDKKFALLATTGCAAINIKGQTIYNFLKMDINNKTNLAYRTYEAKFIADTDIIIIDEMSMLNRELYYDMENLFTKFCKPEFNEGMKFGKRHIIMFGDFAQLPAIGKQIYQSPDFLNDFKFMRLIQVMRQENKEFLDILANVRKGEYTDDVCRFLDNCNKDFKDKTQIEEQVAYIINCRNNSDDPTDYENLIILAPTHEQREKYNSTILRQIRGEIFNNDHNEKIGKNNTIGILAHDTIMGSDGKRILPSDIEWMKTLLKSAYPELLQIKPGAKVLLRRNVDVANGWVNGTLARVHSIDNHCVLIQKLDNKDSFLPVFQQEQVVDRAGKTFTRTQFPLELAYAITIHKCQGMTIKDNVYVNFDKIFNSQQPYVALSRATKPENVFVLNNIDSTDDERKKKKLKPSVRLKAILEFVEHRDIFGEVYDPKWPIPDILIDKELVNEHANWYRRPKPIKVEKPDLSMDHENGQESSSNQMDVDSRQSPAKRGIHKVDGTVEDTPSKKRPIDDEISSAVKNLRFDEIVIVDTASLNETYVRSSREILNRILDAKVFDSMETLAQYWQTHDFTDFANQMIEYLQTFPVRYYSGEVKDFGYISDIQDEIKALHVPIVTPGDSNCFYHAGSLALTGTTHLMPCIRLAIVAKMIEHREQLVVPGGILRRINMARSTTEFYYDNTGRKYYREYTLTLVDLAFSVALMSTPSNHLIPQHLKNAMLSRDALDTWNYAGNFSHWMLSMVLARPIDNLNYHNHGIAQRYAWSTNILNKPPISIAYVRIGAHYVCCLPKNEQCLNAQRYTYFCKFMDPIENEQFAQRDPAEKPANEVQFLGYPFEVILDG